MSTEPAVAPASTPANLRGDRITYGAVHLDVVDLERSLQFWRELIGLRELPGPAGEAHLGVDGRELLVLRPGAERPAGRGHAGLYHVAIHLPDAVEFARVIVRLAQARVPQSPTDHIFSKATYLHDPDGIMLELTLETPERFGSMEVGPGSVYITDSEGRRRGPTEPLDVQAAIAPLAGGEVDLPLPTGTYIGHVHLHVADLQGAFDFYRDVIGFDEHAYLGAIGMADLSAGGRFPHRLAVNNWQGTGARQAPPGTAGMRRYELKLLGEGRLGGLVDRAAAAGSAPSASADGSISLRDPAGNEIILREETS